MKVTDCQTRILELRHLRSELQAKISQEAQILEHLRLHKAKLGFESHASMFMEMRRLNEENYLLAQNVSRDVPSLRVDGPCLLRAEGCKEETIRLLTVRLNDLRTILDKMQTDPLNPLHSTGVLLNPPNRSVEVSHLMQVNQQLLGKAKQLEFQERALKEAIERMRQLLFKNLLKKNLEDPRLKPSTLDRDFYSLANLQKRQQPINVQQETLKHQLPLSQKPSEQQVRMMDQLHSNVDIFTAFTMPVPTPFGKARPIGSLLNGNGAVEMVEYNNPRKHSTWENLKSMLLAYTPWGRSETLEAQTLHNEALRNLAVRNQALKKQILKKQTLKKQALDPPIL